MWIFFLVFFTVLFWLPVYLHGQQVIERVEVKGNIRIPQKTILYYFGLRSGYVYDTESIEEGLKSLWASGFFEDIKIKVNKGKKGQVVFLILDEYPIVKKLGFKTDKQIKKREILSRIQEKNIDFKPYSVYDPHKAHKIGLMIKGMLEEKGFDEGNVSLETIEKGTSGVEVHYHIKEGTRYRIGEIIFDGAPKLKKNVLFDAVQNNQEHNLVSWIRGKDILRKAKLDEDLDSLKKIFRKHGYAEATIGEPKIEDISRTTLLLGKRMMKKIVLPVDAGYQYFLGKVKFEGNEFFTSQQISPLIQSKKGDLFNGELITHDIQRIKERYQNAGYFFVQILSIEHLDGQNQRVDVTFHIYEGDRASLHRLKITGNNFTKDKFLRKEMLVEEQKTFCLELFQKSLKKLMRSEMVRIEEDPEIRPDPENPSQIDIHLKVEEIHKDEWQLTGGYSGYQGAFAGGKLSFIDILGTGEKLDLMLEYGERSKNYSVGYFKPYLLNKLVSFRLKLLNKEDVYPGLFDRKGKGIHLGLDAKFEGSWRAGLGYDYEQVDAASFGIEGNKKETDQHISSISALLYRDTVDNPFFPSVGMRCMLSAELANSLLGSDFRHIKTEIEGAVFSPLANGHVLGLHLEYQSMIPFEDSKIPFWERFYLGGERSIRGYDIYSIGPRNSDGRNVGGEKSLVINLEYMIPLLEDFYSYIFYDIGNAYRYSEKMDLRELYWSLGLELRWRIPRIQIPVRLILAYNNRLIDPGYSHLAFRVALGTSF